MIKCKKCHKENKPKAKFCMHCGEEVHKKIEHKKKQNKEESNFLTKSKNWVKKHPVWSAIIILAIIGLALSINSLIQGTNIQGDTFGNIQQTTQTSSESNEVSKEVEICSPNWKCSSWSDCSSLGTQTRTCNDQNSCGTSEGKPSVKQSCIVVVEEQDTATLGEKNALKSAKSYLSFSAFSYEGLISQLEYEGYTNEEAVYGADNCGANWKEQALKSAKSYLSFSAFSYEGLISQLEYEGFTREQAEYGVDNSEADWFEQAALSAESYLSFSAFSRDGLIDQLEYEGFTREQAEYGVEAVGY